MNAKQVRRLALSLPEASEEPHFHLASFRVKNKVFATLAPDGSYLNVFVDDTLREVMVAVDPKAYETLWWGKSAYLHVHVHAAKPKDVKTLLHAAWQRRAPRNVRSMARESHADALLAHYPDPVRAMAAAARTFLKNALPDIAESVDERAKLLGYRYGPGYKGLICTLILSQKEIKLGIFRGAELPDPKKLMTGSGKVHRHVPLRSAADVEQPGLKALVASALAAWKARNA